MNNNYMMSEELNTNWAEFRIRSILHPETLTNEEVSKAAKYRYRRSTLDDSKLSNEQRDILGKFYLKKKLEDNCNPISIVIVLIRLVKFALFVNKPFKEVTKEDVINFFDKISSYKTSSVNNIKVTLRDFYKWLYATDGYPDIVKWLTVKNGYGFKLPEEILTEDDIAKMVEKADNSRDKALIFVTFESGTRVSEVLNLKIKHVSFDEYGAVIMVNGKTGQRRIRLIYSVPILKEWLNKHPNKNDPEAPLWINLSKSRYGRALLNDGITGVLKSAAKRASVTKKVNPHALRHARATKLAKELTEQELKIFFGWTKSSPMASIYVHLSGYDIDRKLLANAGRLKENEVLESKLKPVKCGRCGEENSVSNNFCTKCYYPLNLGAINQVDALKSYVNEFVTTKLLQKPGLIEELPQLVEEWDKDKNK